MSFPFLPPTFSTTCGFAPPTFQLLRNALINILFSGTDQLRQRLADLGHEKEKLVDEVDHVSTMNKSLMDQIENKISELENKTKVILLQKLLYWMEIFV